MTDAVDPRAVEAAAMVQDAIERSPLGGAVTRERGAATMTIEQYTDDHSADCVIVIECRVRRP